MVQISSRFVADLNALADLERKMKELDPTFRGYNRKLSEDIWAISDIMFLSIVECLKYSTIELQILYSRDLSFKVGH